MVNSGQVLVADPDVASFHQTHILETLSPRREMSTMSTLQLLVLVLAHQMTQSVL
jgi:hypothetical protein